MKFVCDVPTIEQLVHAHEIYAQNELRGTDEYFDALHGVEQGFQAGSVSAAAKAIAMLLKSWNKNHLRFHPDKKARLESDVEQLIIANRSALDGIRGRSITSLTAADRLTVVSLFAAFEGKLGPVGAAKALNLIAPSFFPLWDNPISFNYGVGLSAVGYALFMVISKFQVESLAGPLPDGLAPLKTIDEFNYSKYTKSWVN
jgi:hypothetical protein